jgi:hypothetical protein
MMINHSALSKLWGATLMAIALGSSPVAMAQTLNDFDPDNAEDLAPATGNIRDLDGLEAREVSDWFRKNGISEGRSEIILLEVNEESYTPTVNDPQIIRNQENNWKNNASGNPKKTGRGIPLGEF